VSQATIPATIPAPTPTELHRKVKKTPRSHAVRTVKYLLLILFMLVVLIPAYVLVVTSFKSFSEALSPNRWALPQTLSTEGWSAAWTELSPALLRTADRHTGGGDLLDAGCG